MIVKEEIKGSKLWNVPLGGLFKYADRFFIKTSDRFFIKTDACCFDNHHINCVDVKSGYYTYIDDFTLVEYLPDAFITVGESKK